MRRGLIFGFVVLAVVAWVMPSDYRWFLGLPLPQFVSLTLAALAALAWAAPWVRSDPVTALLAGCVGALVVWLTMVTVMPIFVIGTAAAILRWAYRQRRAARLDHA